MFVYLLTDEACYYSGLKVEGLGIQHVANPTIGPHTLYRCALAAHMLSMVSHTPNRTKQHWCHVFRQHGRLELTDANPTGKALQTSCVATRPACVP